MDKRSLECFVALAEELHFHRAAQRCHISQPGLSQQLQRLEEQLGAQLLFRSKRQVALTRAGAVFLQEARKILRSMGTAVDLTRETDQGVVGHLRVGATPSALFILMPEIVARFRPLLPQVHLHVDAMTTAEQQVALRDQEIQVGICHPPLTDTSLSCEPLSEMPFDVVMGANNPLTRRPRLALEDLAGETFILFPREVGPRLYDHIISMCHQRGFSPRRIIESAPAQTIVAMAACDMGIGFVASRAQHYDRALAVFRSLSGAAPHLTLGAAHMGGATPPMVRQFLDLAIAVGAEAV
ncbi:MAG: LysR family transcriptional regulator [Rhodospirillum sp.]|nr:LysR family transcriptional regulator [Rhodospirillum sp.]MCF8491470.1 LysR family transcriptional regulator [Rhodospirillum sp.]MCF8498878.1 LysR family transcriptional regulator [Rhodospirillum sp.]